MVTSWPSQATASVRQASTRRPSTQTVQAPHVPWSQPFLVPVRSQVLAQRVEQADARLELDDLRLAVDGQRDRAGPGPRTAASADGTTSIAGKAYDGAGRLVLASSPDGLRSSCGRRFGP